MGVGCPSLLQGIFLTRGLNLNLLHCRQILYPLSPQGRPLSACLPLFWPSKAKVFRQTCTYLKTAVYIENTTYKDIKILQARLQQYMNHELPEVQAEFRKGRGTRDQITSIHWIMEKAREFQKNIYFITLLTTPKPLTMWITTNCGKSFKRWKYQTTLPASREICVKVKKQ